MKKYAKAIIISVLVLIVGYFINAKYNPFYKKIQWLNAEIPKHALVKKQDDLRGIISDLFVERGWTYLTLKDGDKIAIPPSRNGLYDTNFVGDLLMPGDSVVKSPDSDTLKVRHNDANYYFVIGKIINEE